MRGGASLAAFVAAGLVVIRAALGADAEPEFPVVDLHVDLPWQLHWKGLPVDLSRGQVTRKTLAAGHVAGLTLPLYVPDGHDGGPTIDDHEAMLATLQAARDAEGSPLLPTFALPAENGPRVRTFLSFEGMHAFAGHPDAIAPFVKRGAVLFGLVHMHDNALGGSSTGVDKGGLTAAGKEIAARVYAEGGTLDVSHLSDAAVADVLAIAKEKKGVVVASHSNARAVCDHPRNLTDDQIGAVAATGGVIGLNLHGPYVVRGRKPTLADVVAQLDHLVAIAGDEHVAIGSDFDGGISPPKALPTPAEFPKLAAALRKKGWEDARIRRIFAENALRVLTAKKSEKPAP